jgi:hypothetical protein
MLQESGSNEIFLFCAQQGVGVIIVKHRTGPITALSSYSSPASSAAWRSRSNFLYPHGKQPTLTLSREAQALPVPYNWTRRHNQWVFLPARLPAPALQNQRGCVWPYLIVAHHHALLPVIRRAT